MPGPLDSLIARVPGCSRLPPEALAALAGASRLEVFPHGARILEEGDPAPDWYAVLESGVIEVSRGDLDAGQVVDRLGAGDVLDPGPAGTPALCSALAREPSHCVLVPQSGVAGLRGSLAPGLTARYQGDVALFSRRVSDLLRGPPLAAAADMPVAEAAALMTRRGVGSIIVLGADGAPVGIVTDRDVRGRVVAAGRSARTPLGAVMTAPLVSTEPDRPAFEALLEMTRRGIRHLAVVSEGRLVGVLSTQDLVMLHGGHPVALARDIELADSVDRLAHVAPGLHGVVRWLAGAGARAFDIGRIVAELNDRLVRRCLDLLLPALEAEGHGRPPMPWTWLAAGSEGRREQSLKTDQDNGLVFRDPAPGGEEAASDYFGRLAGAMRDALERLGVPPCDGGFMAANPDWCQPDAVWRRRFEAWMATPHPAEVLRASLFFDLRPVAGDLPLGRALWDWVCERAPSRTVFLRHMAKAALEHQVPLGFFGGFVVERSGAHKDEVDLKARGVFPMTQAARVHALSLGLRETNTVDRLVAAGARGVLPGSRVDDLRDAWEIIGRLRLAHQLECVDAGRAPDNFLAPKALGSADRLLLKQAFRTIAWLQADIQERFQTALVA